jgi:hypothetical protein
MITREELLAVLQDKPTYFELDDAPENDVWVFETRDNGDVGEEEPGAQDIHEGYRLRGLLRKAFPKHNVRMETVDEWVMVMIAAEPNQ